MRERTISTRRAVRTCLLTRSAVGVGVGSLATVAGVDAAGAGNAAGICASGGGVTPSTVGRPESTVAPMEFGAEEGRMFDDPPGLASAGGCTVA